MIITIHTVADDNLKDLAVITAPNRLGYCLRHNYQLRLSKFVSSDSYFMEIERLMQLIDALKDCHWLVSMGADTVFTNMTIKFEDIINKYNNCDVIVAEDVNGINCDIMLMKNTPAVKNWLMNLVYLTKEYTAYQFAMATFKPEGFKLGVIHQKEINAMPYWLYNYPDDKGGKWEQGDFIFHAPGLAIPDKIKVINEVLEKVVR